VALTFATNASTGPPLKLRSGPTVSGKVRAVEVVEPVTYALPEVSTATSYAMSKPEPPM
jgi:hypothetical protein